MYNTTCPGCGIPDQLEVYSGRFTCQGMYLVSDGFSFSDAKTVDTEDERVRCTACDAIWGLNQLMVEEE